MASRLVPPPSISIEAAEQQFDLFFDEYFKPETKLIAQPQGEPLSLKRTNNSKGEIRLEGGPAGEEADEVYVEEAQRDPQQVAKQQAVCEVARMLKDLGDDFNEKFGKLPITSDPMLLAALFSPKTSLEYDTFKNAVEGLTTNDRNKANFVFMMCVSRKVVDHVGHYAGKAKNYFRRYIGETYIEAVAKAGGVSEFVGPIP